MKANNHDNCDLSPLANVSKRTAVATAISERTVTSILKEEKGMPSTSAKFLSPMKKRRKRSSKFDFDIFDTNLIRSTIQNYHIEPNEILSLAKLRSVLKEKKTFDGCLSTLRSLLIKLSYKWRKISSIRRVLHERHDLQLWHLK